MSQHPLASAATGGALLAAALLAGALRGQDPNAPVVPPFGQSPFGQEPRSGYPPAPVMPGQLPVPPIGSQVPGTMLPGARDPAQAGWVLPRTGSTFTGFPVFPRRLQGYASQVPGYGAYPAEPGAAGGRVPLLPLPPGEPVNAWPEGARGLGAEPLPFAPDVALLVRDADRVWWRASPEEPFVPLFFHDKLRTLGAGAGVEVRQTGEFELLLHDSSRVAATGPTRIELVELGAGSVRLRVETLTWLRLAATARAHELTLPGGTVLRIAAPAEPAAAEPAAPAAPAPAPSFLPLPLPLPLPAGEALPAGTLIVLERASEPAWFGGRATLTNLGGTEVSVEHPGGTLALAPSHRVTLLLQPPAAFVPAGLALDGAVAAAEGEAVVCRAERAGRVGFHGAQFTLPEGASVRLEPLQGRPFARTAQAP